MERITRYYNTGFILLMSLGETWVLLSTDKYWPLSVDDYLGTAVLAWCTFGLKGVSRYQGCALTYAAMFGNIYAMLFTRLDPLHGSGERIVALLVILAVLGGGLAFSLIAQKKATR